MAWEAQVEWVQWVVNQVQCKCQEVVALVEQVVQELLVPEPELVEQEAQVLALLAVWEELLVWEECLQAWVAWE